MKLETDDELRMRTQAKIVGWSSAGSREAYIFHALNSDPRVKEANAESSTDTELNFALSF